jgi:hypothetical protein
LRIESFETEKKYYLLYVDVIRRPTNEYLNLQWSPSRGKYAFLSFLRSGRVHSRRAIESLSEEIVEIPDVSGQIHLMLKCLLDTNNTTAINLGVALGAVPISVNNPISEFPTLDISWDEVRVSCYADTAIQLQLFAQDYEVCKPGDKNTDKGGEPVPPPPPVPPGTPIEDISQPYDEATFDDGLTSPYPGDGLLTEPLPAQREGIIYILRFTFDILDSNLNISSTNNVEYIFFGPLIEYGISNNLPSIGYGGSVGAYCSGYNEDRTVRRASNGFGTIGSTFAANLRNFSVVEA